MKKGNLFSRGLATVLTVAMAMGVMVAPGFSTTAHAYSINNSMATAQELQNGIPTEGVIEKDDPSRVKWYKVTNTTGQDAVVNVSLTESGTSEWPHYYIFDDSGVTEQRSGLCTGIGERETIGLDAGQTKYIKMELKAGRKAGFILSVKITPEEKNGFKGLKKINSGKSIFGNLDYKEDVDIYKIKAKKTGTMVVTITSNNAYGLLYTVYNNGRAAKASGRLGKAESFKKKIKVKKGKCVYVKVSSRGSIIDELGDYTIQTKIKKR